MNNEKRIMVTGASGFLGKALVETLLHKKRGEIIAVCRTDAHCRTWQHHPHLHTVSADLSVEKEIQTLMADTRPEIIFHLAAVARLGDGEQHPEKAIKTNLLGSMGLLQQAAKYGTKKFLFTSSDLARAAKSTVGISKLLMENYLRLFPKPLPQVISFRMPNLYGFPGSVMDIFARQIAKNQDLTITDERMARRFIHRGEAVSYLFYLLEKGENHQIYSVKQEPLFIKDLALQMIADSGKNLQLRVIGARPGEKLFQASYADTEAADTGYGHLALLRLPPPSIEQIFACIQQLPVSREWQALLQNRFQQLF